MPSRSVSLTAEFRSRGTQVRPLTSHAIGFARSYGVANLSCGGPPLHTITSKRTLVSCIYNSHGILWCYV